jgi:hypothetical protein
MSIGREGYSYGSATQARVFAFGTVAAQHEEVLIPAMLARLRDAFCFCEGGYIVVFDTGQSQEFVLFSRRK